MPFVHGSKAAVWLDAIDLTTYLTAAEFSADVDTADSTTFGANWKTALVGTIGAKFGAQGYYDPANVQKFSPAMLSTAGSLITYGPGGLAMSAPARLIEVASTSWSESSPVGGVVAIKWDVIADTSVGFGYVANPISDLGASPATGAGLDGLAQTTTGWQAHLHVTAVSGSGSWVVKLVDDSASNFASVADVTGGAFTTTAVATQQRLVSAAGATLRRYVRVVATRTGGVVGDRITFGVVVARNL
jgi:hypothetical protein